MNSINITIDPISWVILGAVGGLMLFILNKYLAKQDDKTKSDELIYKELTKSISGLNETISSFREKFNSINSGCTERHGSITERLNSHSEKLADHEKRISHLEP
jgi:peptidoglycan hydrolase CwlO-like protein